MSSIPTNRSFREKLTSSEKMIGTFVKIPGPQVIEILASSGLDFIVLDAEHAPFDRYQLDLSIFAARSIGLPVLVRVAGNCPNLISSVLDSGADGIVAPHISTRQHAERVIQACIYKNGDRGYSGSVRSADYGSESLNNVVTNSDKTVCIIAQIEDANALDAIEDIVTLDRLDSIFIGRADLAVSLGVNSISHKEVREAIDVISDSARRVGKALSGFSSSIDDAMDLAEKGINCQVWGSDLSMIRIQSKHINLEFNKTKNEKAVNASVT